MTRVVFPSLGCYLSWMTIGVGAGVWALAFSKLGYALSPPDGWYFAWSQWPGGVPAGIVIWELCVVALPSTGLGGYLAGRVSRRIGQRYLLAGSLSVTLACLVVMSASPALGFLTALHQNRLLWWEYLPEAILFISVYLGRWGFFTPQRQQVKHKVSA
jgi:hypothetical protein